MRNLFMTALVCMLLNACKDGTGSGARTVAKPAKAQVPSIVLIPLGPNTEHTAGYVGIKLKGIYPDVRVKAREMLPAMAFNGERYRADSLIRWMRDRAGKDEIFVGITHQDVSTTKNGDTDWGVIGLGYQPGKACVVSTHRIRNKKGENIFKVVVHEIGHTRGLPHCPAETCYMADAKGKDPTEKETGFCNNCASVLRKQGWKL